MPGKLCDMGDKKIHAYIDYEDTYVQPLLLAALRAKLPPELLVFVHAQDLPPRPNRVLQWRQYESIDFDHLSTNTETCLANSYVIRKALIRKHYLSATVVHWLTKNPKSPLQRHVKPSVEFEVDYAEFLDDALIEAFELKQSWERNLSRTPQEKEWWILKPGMCDRGQGIRLFSSEEEMTSIFADWDPPSDDEDEPEQTEDCSNNGSTNAQSGSNGVITSQLRHFVAQPYIHPPLLLPSPHPSAHRKFHIRSYIVAVGALKVYVYRPMLALFAAQQYASPSSTENPNDRLQQHLSNTCLQSGEREGSVHLFWSLPSSSLPGLDQPGGEQQDWRQSVFDQICSITSETFQAAARSMSIHFQPVPNAFEIFGVDFLVDSDGTAWLLEVNSFPDFAQTGDDLKELVAGLFEGVVDVAVKPFFNLDGGEEPGAHSLSVGRDGQDLMVEVLNIDLGRR